MDPDQRREQIRQAGGIWIRNYDLSSADFLWIEDAHRKEAWCFERAQRIGETPGFMGPVQLPYKSNLPRWIETHFRYYEGTLDEFIGDEPQNLNP